MSSWSSARTDRRAIRFSPRMKKRLRRKGAKLIVVDPRRIDLVETPHVKASHHLQLKPAHNVAVINALAHVIVTKVSPMSAS